MLPGYDAEVNLATQLTPEQIEQWRAKTIKLDPTRDGSVYVKPQDMEWSPSQFPGIQIKVLYKNDEAGEMTCLLKWEPGARLPFHMHPEIEQSWVLEGSFSDHDGICRKGEYVWRHPGSMHETYSEEGARSSRSTASRTSSRRAPDSRPGRRRSSPIRFAAQHHSRGAQ